MGYTQEPGWNWTSFNLIPASHGALDTCMTVNEAWKEGDVIKNPNTRQFSTYSDSAKTFVGALNTFHYSQMYMIYSRNGNTMHISGMNLPSDSMKIHVRGDGQWSVMPCLLKQVTPVAEALSDYYDNAKAGDLIKSHDHFAYFSEDKKWEGDLTALRPGEGYLFHRLAPGTKEITFYNRSNSVSGLSAKRSVSANGLSGEAGLYSNPKAATNMTMIAKIEGLTAERSNSVSGLTSNSVAVYVGDELAAVAEPIIITNDQSPMTNGEALYFLTIQSDRVGELRFEMNGEWLTASGERIRYEADVHYGSLKAPIVLKKEDSRPYKIIENNHVVIIRNNERYDATGKKLQ